MRKLLSANFARLWRSKLFWIVLVALVAMSAGAVWMEHHYELSHYSAQVYADDVMFALFPAISFVCAGFIGLFLGTEYDDHTIRNKLVVGHTRAELYLANLWTCTAASLLFLAAMLLPSTVLGWLLYRAFLLPWDVLCFLVLCALLITMVYTAICVGISMNLSGRAVSLVVSLLLVFALSLVASMLQTALVEPEMTYDGVTITADGVTFGNYIQNPAYVSGTRRVVMEFIYDLLPSGQAVQLCHQEQNGCAWWPLYSLIVLVPSVLAGWMSFRKKDIR